jgi:hypothetical protein
MAKQILSEQFRRMQKLAGIITEEQLNEEQSNYSIELLVPKVYFNVETGELSGNKYEWYSERELRAGADQTSYANAEELDTVVFSNDYNTAMDFASEYPELLKIVSLNEQLNEENEFNAASYFSAMDSKDPNAKAFIQNIKKVADSDLSKRSTIINKLKDHAKANPEVKGKLDAAIEFINS